MLIGGNVKNFESWEKMVIDGQSTMVLDDNALDALEAGWPKDNLDGVRFYSPRDIVGQAVFVIPSAISFSAKSKSKDDLVLKVLSVADKLENTCFLHLFTAEGAAVYYLSNDLLKKLAVLDPTKLRGALTGEGRPLVDYLKLVNWDAALESDFFPSIKRENIC